MERFDGNMGKWLSTFLIERTQSVKIEGTLSNPKTITSGVPQGSVLGPVMFLIFIADIGMTLKANSWIYIDDSKVTMAPSNHWQSSSITTTVTDLKSVSCVFVVCD